MKGVEEVKANIRYEAPDIEITRYESNIRIMEDGNNDNFNGDEFYRNDSNYDGTIPGDIEGW